MDRKTAVLVSMGFEIVGIVLVAVWIGGWIDQNYGWGGMGLVTAIVIGFVGWLTHVIMILRTLEQSENSGDTKPE